MGKSPSKEFFFSVLWTRSISSISVQMKNWITSKLETPAESPLFEPSQAAPPGCLVYLVRAILKYGERTEVFETFNLWASEELRLRGQRCWIINHLENQRYPTTKTTKTIHLWSLETRWTWHFFSSSHCLVWFIDKNWLVVWNMTFIFHFIYGMSSFPLTNSIIFQDGHIAPPTSNCCDNSRIFMG